MRDLYSDWDQENVLREADWAKVRGEVESRTEEERKLKKEIENIERESEQME